MTGCSAIGCTNRSENGCKMKRFPKDPERRALWISKVKRPNWVPTKRSCLCEFHFDADQWYLTDNGNKRLNPDAIPTIFDQTSKHTKRKSPGERVRQEKNYMVESGSFGNFSHFIDMTDIEKLESKVESLNTKSGVECDTLSDDIDEESMEENDSDDSQEVEDDIPNNRCVSDPASQSCFDDHSEEQDEGVVQKTTISENRLHLPSNATTEDILLGFYGAFQKTNHQLKRNDALLLELFKEQNQIFKTQTQLMRRLLGQNIM